MAPKATAIGDQFAARLSRRLGSFAGTCVPVFAPAPAGADVAVSSFLASSFFVSSFFVSSFLVSSFFASSFLVSSFLVSSFFSWKIICLVLSLRLHRWYSGSIAHFRSDLSFGQRE